MQTNCEKKIVHTPMAPMQSVGDKGHIQALKDEVIELELIKAVISIENYNKIYSIHAVLGEILSKEFA